jgi:hypothetical protein
MTKRAVVVGINDYSQQPATTYFYWPSLGGCLADATSLQSLLTDTFVFDQVTALTDAQATNAAITDALRTMLANSVAGDVAVFAYAGHGGRLPSNPDDQNNPANTRFYDCIVPYSGAYLTDLDFFNLANTLDQSTVNFTLIMDSCHSGGLHQNSPDARLRSGNYTTDLVTMCVNQMDTIIPCGVVIPFGDSSIAGNVSNVTGDGNGMVCSVDDNKSFMPLSKSTVLAACRYDETDADSAGGGGHGGLTQALLNTINASLPQISYRSLVDALRNEMQVNLNLSQTPTLLGQTNRMDEIFLAPWTTSA